MSEKQRTIKKELSLKGVGLHTGSEVTIRLKPAEENAGITFIRVDVPGRPAIKALLENVLTEGGLPRCTSIGKDNVAIHTVEHFLGALFGLGIDNAIVEIDGNELPGLDGSGIEFLKAIKEAGVIEQSASKEYIDIKESIGVNDEEASILIVPDKEFKISYTLDYDHPFLNSQFFSATINSGTFEKEIALCRTFCLEKEANELRTGGLGKGANYENTLVVGNQGVIQNQVRFPDEFARHKVLDFIGDLYLLGKPIRGHVFAIKSGHSLNIELLKRIVKQQKDYEKKDIVSSHEFADQKELDIHQIMKILPHRHPFLFVDRVIELEKGKRAVGIKNVTINDNFFQGHFPSRPVMPGVLMVEAMAQVGGIMVLTNEAHHGKVALFMATDNVKFRKLVEPGDQLLLEVQIERDRPRTALIRGQAKVAGEIVAEADILFSFTDISFLT